MNDWDKDNLRFLMNIDEATFEDWSAQASQDDIDYAMELIKAARLEISMQAAAIFDEVEDLTDARVLLDSIAKRR
jgi:hypothetical protein